MDIDATPALVNSAYQRRVDEHLPSALAFNHVITKFTVNGRTYWVDPTFSHQRGPLSENFIPNYGKALVVEPSACELTEISPCSSTGLLTRIVEVFRIPDYQGAAKMTSETVYRGMVADDFRANISTASRNDIEKGWLNYYAKNFPGIRQAKPVLLSDDPTQNIIRIVADYEIPGLWTLSENGVSKSKVFYPPEIRDMVQRPETLVRTMPLAIVYPRHVVHSIYIQLPERCAARDQNEFLRDDAVQIGYSSVSTGATVILNYDYRALADHVALSNMASHIRMIDRINNLIFYEISVPVHAGGGIDPKRLLNQVNWTLVFLTLVFLALLFMAFIKVYRYGARSLPPPLNNPYPELNDIRGWLILAAIGILFAPVSLLIQIAKTLPVYGIDTWNSLTTPGGRAFNVLWAPYLLVSLFLNLAILVYACTLIPLFFQRRQRFPKLMIIFLLSTLALVWADSLIVLFVPGLSDEKFQAGIMRQLSGTTSKAVIWTLYFLKSKRVRATFTR